MPERAPSDACDTHLHVFGDAKKYSVGNPNALYQPPQDCTFADMTALHDVLGFSRAVLVQPTIYGTDHSLLHDVLAAAPKGRYRGVAIVDDSVSDDELDRLHAVGVRGARFNFGGGFKLAPSQATLRRTLGRVAERGWFVKVFGFGDDFLAVEDELRGIEIPAIVDHMAAPDYRRGTAQPVMRLVLDLLRKDNWWVSLSNGDVRSHVGYPWDDAVEFGRMLYEAAPDRCLWGTDWPHVHRFIRPHKEGAGHPAYGIEHERRLLALLDRYVPDRAALKRVLVDNPRLFFGFD
jgi:2-pyrone-4,6-dicarboxylate lactonase